MQEEPLNPEEDLTQQLSKQEREIHSNLSMLNELYHLCCSATLTIEELRQKAMPILNKLQKSNPLVANEIRELLGSGDQMKVQAYFEKEQAQLIQTLSDELRQHQEINTKINKEKMD
jgi:uncharacterized membrane protein YgaE (UPF0421/DUF939 family)